MEKHSTRSQQRQWRRWLQRGTWKLIPAILLLSMALSGCVTTGSSAAELSGILHISGSTALAPLLDAAQKRFVQQYPSVKVVLTANGSINGLKDVMSGKSDIGASDIYADFAQYPDPNMTDHLICVTPFTMIVNPGVTIPASSLTQEQIIKIFSTREYTNWSQVGGPDLDIVPIARPATSGTRDTFRKYVLKGGDEDNTLTVIDSSQDVLNKVASTPGAIGYLALSVASAAAQKGSIRQLAIQGLAATRENIISGQYAFWSYEHLYTLGDDKPLVTAFLDFMMQSQVQDMARQQGYIPIGAMQLKAAAPAPNTTGQYTQGSRPALQEREVTYREAYTS